MRQFTNESQTAKLIELGFEKPKGLADAEPSSGKWVRPAYSIGELIEMLPLHIFPNKVCFDLRILANQTLWVVKYSALFRDEFHCFCSKELIDALFDMVVELKEEGVI